MCQTRLDSRSTVMVIFTRRHLRPDLAPPSHFEIRQSFRTSSHVTTVFSISSPYLFSDGLQPTHSQPLTHSKKNTGGIPLFFPKRNCEAGLKAREVYQTRRVNLERGTTAPSLRSNEATTDVTHGGQPTRW